MTPEQLAQIDRYLGQMRLCVRLIWGMVGVMALLTMIYVGACIGGFIR